MPYLYNLYVIVQEYENHPAQAQIFLHIRPQRVPASALRFRLSWGLGGALAFLTSCTGKKRAVKLLFIEVGPAVDFAPGTVTLIRRGKLYLSRIAVRQLSAQFS